MTSEEIYGVKGRPLPRVVMEWSAPRVTVGAYTRDRGQKGSERLTLEGEARDFAAYQETWPTPTAVNRVRDAESLENCRRIRKARAGQNTVPLYLEEVAISRAQIWTTPCAGDTSMRDKKFAQGGTPLSMQTQSISRSLHPDPETLPDGEPSSIERRSLNPLFVEWLMGWPIGWTASACAATEFTRWRQRMRGALSQLGSPDAAPVQPSMF